MTPGSAAAYRRSTVRSTGKPLVSGPHRLGREAYFAAAFELLGAEGPEALTIAALCRRLKVTKGSFYHHFSGMPQFTEGLLRHWEHESSARLDEIAGLSDRAYCCRKSGWRHNLKSDKASNVPRSHSTAAHMARIALAPA